MIEGAVPQAIHIHLEKKCVFFISGCDSLQEYLAKYFKITHLIIVGIDDNKHVEACSLGERVVRDTFLLLPLTVSEAVQVDILTNPGVEMKSDVINIRLPCF